MKFKLIILSFYLISVQAFADLPGKLKFEKVFPKLSFERPIGFLKNPVNNKIAYVIGHKGKVWKINFVTGAQSKELILDLSLKVGNNSESGLRDMIFHRDFANNKKIILSYTNDDPKEDRVSSFTMTNKGIDPASEKIYLKVSRPHGEGNVGQVAFGPDECLYVGVGDGGREGDPDQNGQNKNTLYGSILRIDIKNLDKGYAIPKDNPFVNEKDVKHEIWAYGLRFPWRFSFDQKTKFLYCADVGQNQTEEVNIIEKGKNYGWRIKEGSLSFKDSAKEGAEYVKPITEYRREYGLSIIGGYVYRGKIKELQGVYIYCDYVTNNFWGLRFDGKKVTEQKWLGNYSFNVSTFSKDKDGEVYISSFAENNIFKISGTE